MAAVNSRRVALGALAGGVVWTVWSMAVNNLVLGGRYAWAQEKGLMLKEPRYLFLVGWILALFAMAYAIAWLYASAPGSRPTGPPSTGARSAVRSPSGGWSTSGSGRSSPPSWRAGSTGIKGARGSRGRPPR